MEYGRPLYFHPVVSSIFFFSSPNLSSRRLDVYHTSTHSVALMRIYNACLKCAARGSLQIQEAKNAKKCDLGTIPRLCRAISSQLRHVSTIGKKLVLSFFFSSFFLAYSQRSQIGCLPYFHAWLGLSVNLECRSEMCCMHAARWKFRTKKFAKIRHLRTIAQLCRAVSSQLRHVSTIIKKC